jgi:tetrahydromethanopterin S-methyltransferase subunit C
VPKKYFHLFVICIIFSLYLCRRNPKGKHKLKQMFAVRNITKTAKAIKWIAGFGMAEGIGIGVS